MRLDHLVHEIRWSNGTQVVQAGRPRHDMRDAVPPCGTRRRGGAGTKAPEPPPPPPGPPIPPRPTPPGAPGGDPGGPSRPAPRPSALDNPSHHTRGTHSEPLPEQPSQYRLPEIRPDARRITFPVTITGGSSPLARGLPARERRPTRQHGIIPARAGFTIWVFVREMRQRDHPRSRGVYDKTGWHATGAQGSSPLARGLHAVREEQDVGTGIIPARAGFTRRSSAS